MCFCTDYCVCWIGGSTLIPLTVAFLHGPVRSGDCIPPCWNPMLAALWKCEQACQHFRSINVPWYSCSRVIHLLASVDRRTVTEFRCHRLTRYSIARNKFVY